MTGTHHILAYLFPSLECLFKGHEYEVILEYDKGPWTFNIWECSRCGDRDELPQSAEIGYRGKDEYVRYD